MTKELKLTEDPKVTLLVIGEVYARVCQATGHEVLFACDKELFLIAKHEQLIIGNHSMAVNCCSKDMQQKTCGVIKDFGLTYNNFHEMELVPTSFKDAVHRAGDWLGLPL